MPDLRDNRGARKARAEGVDMNFIQNCLSVLLTASLAAGCALRSNVSKELSKLVERYSDIQAQPVDTEFGKLTFPFSGLGMLQSEGETIHAERSGDTLRLVWIYRLNQNERQKKLERGIRIGPYDDSVFETYLDRKLDGHLDHYEAYGEIYDPYRIYPSWPLHGYNPMQSPLKEEDQQNFKSEARKLIKALKEYEREK